MYSVLGMQYMIMRGYVYKVDLVSEHLLEVFRKCLVRRISLQETT